MANSKDTYRTVTPYLLVPDANGELAFLKAAFGGTEANCQRNADNSVMHAEIEIGDSLVMLGQAGGPWKPTSGALYLWVDDVDVTYARAIQAARNRKPARRQAIRAPERRRHRSERRDLVDRRSSQVTTSMARQSVVNAMSAPTDLTRHELTSEKFGLQRRT